MSSSEEEIGDPAEVEIEVDDEASTEAEDSGSDQQQIESDQDSDPIELEVLDDEEEEQEEEEDNEDSDDDIQVEEQVKPNQVPAQPEPHDVEVSEENDEDDAHSECEEIVAEVLSSDDEQMDEGLEQEAQVRTPYVQVPSPEVQVQGVEVRAQVPEAKVPTPEFQVETPKVQVEAPEAQTSEVQIQSPDAQHPSLDSQMQTSQVQEEPEEIQKEPIKVQVQPTEVQVQPAEVQVQPTEVQVQPTEVQVQPTEIQAQPTETHVKPTEVQDQPTVVQDQPTVVQDQATELQDQPSKPHTQPSQIHVQTTEIDVLEPSDVQIQPSESQIQPAEVQVQVSEVQAQPSGAAAAQAPPCESSFSSLFSGVAAASELSPDVQLAILDKWKQLKNELDESRPRVLGDPQRGNLEDRCKELEETVVQLREELASKNVIIHQREDGSELDQIRSHLIQAQSDLNQINNRNQTLESEKEELILDLNRIKSEVEDMSDIAKRRQDQIDIIRREQGSLQDEVIQARASKNQFLIRAEELESRELSLQYREKRLIDERDLMESRVSSLNEELHQTHEELLGVRRENVAKILQMNRDLDEKNDFVRHLESQVKSLEENKSGLEERLEDVLERLKAARNSTNIEETHRHEIRAHERVAEIYKEQVRDTEEKCQELQKAVETLQSLLKEASQRYGKLEETYEQDKKEQKEELKRRNDAIRALKKELDDANILIKTLKQKDLVESGIAQLSPAASIASRLVKSGMSLTQVYTQLVSCEEELITTKDENSRLNSYIEQILLDIEERAPAMKRQREDYEHAVDSLKTLERFLEDERELNSTYKQEVDINRQRLATAGRENERVRRLNNDLGQQVAVLLREVESARFGGRPMLDESNQETLNNSSLSGDADSVISQRLVTFRDVRELQQRNAELLAVIREMSAKQENTESQMVEEKTNELKEELELVTAQVQELREARRRQETMVETIVQQRDMYKAISEGSGDVVKTPSGPKVTSTPGIVGTPSPKVKSSLAVQELEVRAAKAESALSEMKKDFEEFKKLKADQDKILEEKLEKAREDLNESRAKSIKLASQEEYNTERFKISQANAATYKKEIANLESKKNALQADMAKRDHSIQVLQGQLAELQSRMGRTESELHRSRQEVNHYKNAEARLSSEVSMLQRQTTGSSVIAENLKKFQMQLEKTDNEDKKRLQSTNETLSKEVTLLRKKLDSEQESYRAAVKAWEASQNQLRLQVEQLTSNENKAQAKLQETMAAMDDLRTQLQSSQEKWGESSSGNISIDGSGPTPKLADLQAQVRALKNDCVNLKELLSNSRQASLKFQELAEAAEARVVENTEAARVMRDNYEQQLLAANQTKTALDDRVKQLLKERDDLVVTVRALEAREDPVEQVERELTQTRSELYRVDQELKESVKVRSNLLVELSQQATLFREMEERYEREVVLHGETTTSLVQLRETAKSFDEKVVELETSKRQAVEMLEDVQIRFKDLESSSRTETELLQKQVDVIEKENAALHEQLTNMSHQLTTLNKSGADLDVSLQGNESSDQLMDIVKYLRREKEILTTKMEVMQSESTRIRSQLDFAQKELAESRSALVLAMEKANAAILPSSKYAQLLENVEAIPALNESNRALRQSKESLEKEMEALKAKLDEALTSVEPLQEKVREAEEKGDKLSAELEALKGDNIRWRQRANQLIEKSHKINPEEMKRIENENSKLTNHLKQLQAQLKNQVTQVNNLNTKLKDADEKIKSTTESKDAEIKKLTHDAVTSKTLNQQIGARLNQFNKKITELESNLKTVQAERDAAKGELERAKVQVQAGAKSQTELETLNKTLTEKSAKITALEASLKEKEGNVRSLTVSMNKLKQLGRSFKEKFEKKEAELVERTAALTKVEEELKKAREDVTSSQVATTADTETSSVVSVNDEKLAEAELLVEQSSARITELEEKIEEILEENRKLQDSTNKAIKKEERAKGILVQVKDKITKLTEEKENLGKEISELRTQNQSQQVQQLRTDLEAKMDALRGEKEQQIGELLAEKERLQQQVEQLQQEIKVFVQSQQQALSLGAEKSDKTTTETVTASVKPVMATAAQAAAQRKTSVQPQAHIQPTRHTPAQTATMVVRPTAMRTTSAAIRTTSQSDVQQLPQMSVQPILSSVVPTSLSTASTMAPIMTSLVAQDQSEDIQRTMHQNTTLSNDDVPRALVQPRQSSEEPVAGPSFVASPSVSVVSIAPTQKRTRDTNEPDAAETDNKKPRVATAPAEIPATSSEAPAPVVAPAARAEDVDIVELESSEDEIDEDQPVEEGEEIEGSDEEPEEEMAQDVQDEEEGEYESQDEEAEEEEERLDEEEEQDMDESDEDQPEQQQQQHDEIVIVDSDDDDDQALQIVTSNDDSSSNRIVPSVVTSSLNVTSAEVTSADMESILVRQPQAVEAGDSVVPSSSAFVESLSTNEDVSELLSAEGDESNDQFASPSNQAESNSNVDNQPANSNVDNQPEFAPDTEEQEGPQEGGQPIQVLTSSGEGHRGRGTRRGPRLTRTPIVWNQSFGTSQENSAAGARGRGGTARRARGSQFFGRGITRPLSKSRGGQL